MNWDLDEQTFAAWAPAGVIWSEWAKPVAFVSAHELTRETTAVVEETRIPLTLDSSSAVVIDLPGAEAVHVGLILFERGFCPVPLFNATSGPSPVIDMTPVTRALVTGVERLKQRQIPPTAPPAFLLDSRRGGVGITLKPGLYDNRWVTLPQDFPSAALLASRGIRNATLLLRGSRTGTLLQPGSPAIPLDLAHVLRRWQDQGIVIRVVDVATGETADNVTVPKPSGFRLAWYAAIALLGLRRSNVGGFGSSIPEQTSGSGYG